MYIGQAGLSHFRAQDSAIEKVIGTGLDDLAVSVLNSKWLADHLLATAARDHLPVITFDSDDAIISVGHWPVYDADGYRRPMSSFKSALLDTGKKTIIVAVGQLTQNQAELPDDGLVYADVQIDFKEIGHKSYRYMKMLSENKTVPEMTYTANQNDVSLQPLNDMVCPTRHPLAPHFHFKNDLFH